MDLSTKYLGLTLKNPIVVASCGLTQTLEQIQACEQAGAAAVVMKSVFEEQIRQQNSGLEDSAMMHTEAMEYLRADADMLYGPREYVDTIKKAKKAVSIPVIASVNCYTSKWWINYAQELEAAGSDAIELNVYVAPFDYDKTAADIEQTYLDILQSVRSKVKIPVVLKLSPYFTALANFARKADELGASGLVLFNRFIQPEIDIARMKSHVKGSFHDPAGFANSLRWTALLSGSLKLDIAVSGGVQDADGVIKQLLAGAAVTQIASVLYVDGLGKINQMLSGIQKWMESKGFQSVANFKGRLNQKNDPQSQAFVRAQYMKAIANVY